MSKKILSLALAVVMLFSICAVAVSAVQGDGSENIRIYMTSDATVGAPAGTVVNVSYYVDLPDGIDELNMCIGNIAIGYNSAAYKVNSTGTSTANDARTWGDDFGQYMKSTSAVTVSSTISTNIVKKFNANDTAKGWDKALQIGMAYDGTNSTSATGIPVYDDMHIFTISFVAQRALTADDVIGVVEGAYGQSFFKVCWHNGTNTAQTYPVAQVNMADAAAVAPSAPAYDVYHVAANNGDAKTRENANDSSKYDIGVNFGFKKATIDPAFNANGTSENITAITATVTANMANGSTATVTPEGIRFLYYLDGAKTELGFNVIIAGIPKGAADVTSYTITPAITTADGNTYTCETKTITVADLQFA